MNFTDVNTMPSFLGIQMSNGDVIPIDVRYVGKNRIVFSLPSHNSKQKYMVSGYIGEDVDIAALKNTLSPFIVHFTEDEERKEINKKDQDSELNVTLTDMEVDATKPSRKRSIAETSTENFIPRKKQWDSSKNIEIHNIYSTEGQIMKNDNFNFKPNYGYKIPTNQPLTYQNQDDFFTQQPTLPEYSEVPIIQEVKYKYPTGRNKEEYASNLLTTGFKLYESDRFNGEINEKALHMLRESQIIYNELYPESFPRIVLPGTCHQVIHNIDPDAFMMPPRQFRRFMKRRQQLAHLRKVGLIRKRTSGVLYPMRQKRAQERARDEFGIFLKK